MAKRPRASRKRSAASSSSPEPPEPLVFFVDRSLGQKKVPDATWLAEVGRQHWVVLTKDQGIRYSEIERRQLMAAGVRCFVLVSRNVTGDDMAAILVSALARISDVCRKHAGPFISKVFRDSTVRIWLSARRGRW